MLEHLTKAERHVEEARVRIANQQKLIAKLQCAGYDTSEAEALLRTFEKWLVLHIATRDRLRAALTPAGLQQPGGLETPASQLTTRT